MRKITVTKLWLLLYFFLFFIFMFIFKTVTVSISLAVFVSLMINYPVQKLAIESYPKRIITVRIIMAVAIWGIFFLMVVFVIPIILNTVPRIQDAFKEFFQLQASKVGTDTHEIYQILYKFSDNIDEFTMNIVKTITSYISSNIFNWATGAVIVIIAASFFAQVMDKFKYFLWMLFPGCDHKKLYGYFHDLHIEMQEYVGGQVIVSLIMGSLFGVACFFLGIKEFLFLGLLGFITNFIPYIGLVITAIPIFILSYLNNGLPGFWWSVALVIAISQGVSWVVSPKILSKRVNINWFVILISILAFGELLGIFGTLLAVPIVLVIKNFWKEFMLKVDEKKRFHDFLDKKNEPKIKSHLEKQKDSPT